MKLSNQLAPLLFLLFVGCGGPSSNTAQSLIPQQPPQLVDKPVLLNDHVVRGHIFAANGKPLLLAHAHLMGPAGDNKPVESVQAGGDGSFTLPLARLPAQDKFARIQLSGVDHHVETLIVALDEAVDVEARLGTYRHAPLGTSALEEKPTVMLFLPGGSRAQHQLEKHPTDGTYTSEITVKDGQYGYEITGLTLEGHTINGTTVEDGGYAYDDDGDYESRVNVTGGKFRIVFDPSKRPPSGLPATLKFANEASVTAGLTEIFRRIDTERTAWQAEAQATTKDPKSFLPEIEKKSEALSQSVAALEKNAKHPLVRQTAAIAYFQEKPLKEDQAISEEDKARAQRVIESASAEGGNATSDALWALFPAALAKIVKAAGETTKAEALRRTVIDTHPSPNVVANLLGAKLHSKNITVEEKREIVQALRSPRFRGTFAQRDAELLDPDRLIAPGKPMPSFEVRPLAIPVAAGASAAAAAALGAPKEKAITQKAFEGKVYLVDLWATWCKPCLAELPSMHELFAKYGGAPDPAKSPKRTKQFAIMSVSLDEKPETVTKFRTDKTHPMPWLQGFAGSGDSAEATLKALTGKSSAPIPFYVLVDDKGKIVASSPELRLSEVPAMLERLLL